jgi:hypothetical protein
MAPTKALERVPGDPDATRVMLVAAGPTGQSERMRPPLAGVTVVINVRVR